MPEPLTPPTMQKGRAWQPLHLAAYANRYISVLTIVDRKVTRWRDYLDPIAVFEAVGWPPRV